jgi:hypothetical protein
MHGHQHALALQQPVVLSKRKMACGADNIPFESATRTVACTSCSHREKCGRKHTDWVLDWVVAWQ